MSVDYRKVIMSTILYTLLSLVVLLAIFVMLMFFVFTKDLANFMYNVGFDKMASNLYYRVYEKSDEIIYCYKALNIKISLGDNDKIVEYYESFTSDEEYKEFMSANVQRNEKLNVGVLEKSTILNEENYLVNRYVLALLNIEEKDKAVDVAVDSLIGYENATLKAQGIYAFSGFISENNSEVFNKVYDGFDESLINELQNYFDNLVSVFDNNSDASSNVDKAYLMALGNRIILVGQDINQMYVYMNINTDEIAQNNATLNNVNNVIKGLI